MTQNLLLDAAAIFHKNQKVTKQFQSWESQLSNWRISKAGQTHPSWIKANGVGAGVLLKWEAPSLDTHDDKMSEEDQPAIHEPSFYMNGRRPKLPPPLEDLEVAVLQNEMAQDFKDEP